MERTQFPGGTFTRSQPAPFHGARAMGNLTSIDETAFQVEASDSFRVADQPEVIAFVAQLEAGPQVRVRRTGTRRSWDELEANLPDQGLIARVGVNKVEERVILDVDEVGIVLPEGVVKILHGFIFIACVRNGLSEDIG